MVILLSISFFFSDLAAIRRLLDSEHSAGTTCPSCGMPFDKGKKRRLIDNCGHERCYSCMFKNEACPVCSIDDGSTIHDGKFFPNNCITKLGK